MINEKLEKAFNDQINKELYSEYLYLSMQAYFERLNLKGFVNWMSVQVQEEHAHALGMFDYLNQRGGNVQLEAIDKPETDWESPLAVFEQVLEHEEYVTSRINALMDVAEETKDRAAMSFLNWYLKEQVEEEDNVGNVLATLKLIGDDKKALLMLDKGYFWISDKKDYLFLSKLYIQKDFRHKGLGTKAFEEIKQLANGKKIQLTVNKHNINSINAYKKWGFKTIDSVVTDIGSGFVMDDYIMEA